VQHTYTIQQPTTAKTNKQQHQHQHQQQQLLHLTFGKQQPIAKGRGGEEYKLDLSEALEVKKVKTTNFSLKGKNPI